MSYLTQMPGRRAELSVAATACVLVALIRGFARQTAQTVGNFWVDVTRTTLLYPAAAVVILALALVSQGVVQTFSAYHTVPLVSRSNTTTRSSTRPASRSRTTRARRTRSRAPLADATVEARQDARGFIRRATAAAGRT